MSPLFFFFFFFFNDTATTEIYTLSLTTLFRSPRRPPCRAGAGDHADREPADRKSTRLNSSHVEISYAVFCLKKKKKQKPDIHLLNKQKKNQHKTIKLPKP